MSYMVNNPTQVQIKLTLAEIRSLVRNPFSSDSPVKLKQSIEDSVLDQIPLFRVLEDFLHIIQREKKVKLTPLGALPKKVLVELYSKKFLLDELIESGITKLNREHDCNFISTANHSARVAGLVRKTNGQLVLTKLALKLIENRSRSELFATFFRAFVEKFNWCYNDLYPDVPIGQDGWAFSLMMVNKFGSEQLSSSFYADLYESILPGVVTYFEDDVFDALRSYHRCYEVRTFSRFMVWFGFVHTSSTGIKYFLELKNFLKTDLINRVFDIADV